MKGSCEAPAVLAGPVKRRPCWPPAHATQCASKGRSPPTQPPPSPPLLLITYLPPSSPSLLAAGPLAALGLAAGAPQSGELQLRRLPDAAPRAALHRGRPAGAGGWVVLPGRAGGRLPRASPRKRAGSGLCLPCRATPCQVPERCCATNSVLHALHPPLPSPSLQAPIPELAQLRQGAGWRQHGLRVPAEQAMPLAADPGLLALDIELTIDRWVGGQRGAVLPPPPLISLDASSCECAETSCT